MSRAKSWKCRPDATVYDVAGVGCNYQEKLASALREAAEVVAEMDNVLCVTLRTWFSNSDNDAGVTIFAEIL